MLDCETADEHYKTARFAGTKEHDSDLYRHACYCTREDWYHALFTSLWHVVERERLRMNPPRYGTRLL